MKNHHLTKIIILGFAFVVVIYSKSNAQERNNIIEEGICGSTYEQCHYTLDENHHMVIEGNGSIKANMFSGRKDINNLTISHGITKIEGNAFLNAGPFNSVIIPDSVTRIWQWAFSTSMAVVPDSVTEMHYAAFPTNSIVYAPKDKYNFRPELDYWRQTKYQKENGDLIVYERDGVTIKGNIFRC